MKKAKFGFLALAVLLSSPLAAATADCLVANVPASVVLPDGSRHPAGTLRICFDRRLNPSATMQVISIDGVPRGSFVGRPTYPEGEVERPFLYFHRNDNDDWILVGFQQPGGSRRGSSEGARLVDPALLQRLIARGLEERPAQPEIVRTASARPPRMIRLAAVAP